MTVLLKVEYDGTDYFGWQQQPGRVTVYGEIRKTLRNIYGENIRLNYTSRTDRGVHASDQVASFDPPFEIPLERIKKAVNSALPGSIIIKSVEKCNEGFNPRYEIDSKLYVYRVLNSSYISYRQHRYVWHIPGEIDWDTVREMAGMIKGEHNFSLFSSAGDKKNHIIEIMECNVSDNGNGLYKLNFRARYFLTYMVRFITGFLISAGKGKRNKEDLVRLLSGKGKRCNFCAPAKGLELRKVYF